MTMTLSEAYEALGVNSYSSMDDIRSAYRKLVKETHPDKGGDPNEFIKIRAAYEILCEMHKSPIQDMDMEIPIPPDLQKIIEEIVSEFRMQFEMAERTCNDAFNNFRSRILNYIQTASRGELRKFNKGFVSTWHSLLEDLLGKFNSEMRRLTSKYDNWFDKTLDEFFEEAYKKELKGYKKSPYFYVYAILLLGLTSLISGLVYDLKTFNGWLYAIGTVSLSIPLLPLIWRIHCNLRRKKPEDIMSIVPFQLNKNVDFQASNILKQGRSGTYMAGAAGAGILNLLTEGIGGPILGAAIGLTVGNIIDRIANPTKKIRAQLDQEVNSFIDMAQPEVTQYILESQQNLLNDLAEKIIQNYEDRMKQTVLMLTEG
jgi:curved DNA-binding protein CbpA